MLADFTLVEIGIIFGAILISMAFHEMMHGFMAHWLGDTTAAEEGRLTLNPLRHIDTFTTILFPMVLILVGLPPFFVAKPVPFNPSLVRYDEFGVALTAIAGPLTNLMLAVVTSIFIHTSGVAVGTDLFRVLSLFMQVNIGFFVFNMIPFPPLDGSRVLYAFAPEPLQAIMRQIETMGFIAILLFMFLLFPILGPFVGDVSETVYLFLMR